MQQIRIQRKARLLRPDLNDVLPLDPRDPDVVRAKARQQDRLSGQRR